MNCPECGSEQDESKFAVSTFCKSCGAHFEIQKGKVKKEDNSGPRVRVASGTSEWEEESMELPSSEEASKSPFTQRDAKPTGPKRSVECFDCGKKHEVSEAASSSFCPSCAAYISLKDEEISMPRRINLRTRGNIVIQKKGSLIGSNIACNSLTVYGQIAGSMDCQGDAVFRTQGKVVGELRCRDFTLEKKSTVHFLQPIYARNVDIFGDFKGDIVCEGKITIHKRASVDGSIKTRAIEVAEDGGYTGELSISDDVKRPERAYDASPFAKSGFDFDDDEDDDDFEENLFGDTSVAKRA